MLCELNITNIVLIKKISLSFTDGLSSLTGETGAGKSILLDSLNLALGRRAEARLVRKNSEFGQVTAFFALAPSPICLTIQHILDEAGIAYIGNDAPFELILRRVLYQDGRSRGFINDAPVSIALLRQIGDHLIEIQGQDDRMGLMDGATHMGLLDEFGHLTNDAEICANSYHQWRNLSIERADLEQALAAQLNERDYLQHAIQEIEEFSPEEAEAESLQERHAFLKNANRTMEAIIAANELIAGNEGAESKLGKAMRGLERAAAGAGARLDQALQAVDLALEQVADANGYLQDIADEMNASADQLKTLEDRLFRMKDLERKYSVPSDGLPALLNEMQNQISALQTSNDRLKDLTLEERKLHDAFLLHADRLGLARRKEAEKLEKAVNQELPALKLEAASFHVHFTSLAQESFGARGGDKVIFHITTNPRSDPGPMQKIASGGELSRFLLALKIALAGTGSAPTLIFDEVDSGIGGATADAVGDRLLKLSKTAQILVVTHSAQVAAKGGSHFHVGKQSNPQGEITTQVTHLSDEEQKIEIARMISGAQITDEALAAAKRLLQ